MRLDKNRIEKWLDFYTFQLKQDLSDVAEFLFNTLELENDQQRIIKGDLFIIDMLVADLSRARNEQKLVGTQAKALVGLIDVVFPSSEQD